MVTSEITASGYVRGYQKHSGDQLLLVGWFGRTAHSAWNFPRPRMQLASPAVEAPSGNHWTAREVRAAASLLMLRMCVESIPSRRSKAQAVTRFSLYILKIHDVSTVPE